MNLPGILTPDLGLFFWMAVAFIVVLLILSKFAFPIIVKMVDERQKFINDSLKYTMRNFQLDKCPCRQRTACHNSGRR